MSRPLNRPMFRMGGSPNTNSGIVSGFAQPRRNFNTGSRQEDDALFDDTAAANNLLGQTLGTGIGTGSTSSVFNNVQASMAVKQAQDERDAITESMAPTKQTGLSASDWLRIAAAGGEILGAEGRGSGIKGALAAAGPALSNLGKGLATSSDAREAAFQTQKSAYDQAKLTAAQADVTSSKEYQQGAQLLQLKNELEPFKFADEQTSAKATELEEKMALLDEDSYEYKQLANQYVNIVYGPTTRANIEAKADLFKDDDFKSQVNAMYNALKTDRDSNEDSPYKSFSDAQLLKAARTDLINQVIVEINLPKGKVKKADGGRIGLANGGGPYEPGSGPDPDPGSPPIMQFEELRSRLPQEVSDSVIRLIMQSEQAMVDFAQIQTPQDIQVFNQKYNTDLQTPNQVA